MTQKRLLILIAYVFSVFIYSLHEWFSTSGMYVLIGTVGVLGGAIWLKPKTIRFYPFKLESLLVTTLIFFTVFLATLGIVDINGFLSLAMWVNRVGLFMIVLLAISYLFSSSTQRVLGWVMRHRYRLIILVGLVVYLTALRVVREPEIDLYPVLKYGPLRLLQLQNPYETEAAVGRAYQEHEDYRFYAYGPTTIFLFLPVDLVFHDPRYLLIVAVLLTTAIIYRLARGAGYTPYMAQVLSLLYLFHPKQLFFLTWSYTDALIIALVGLGLWAWDQKRDFMSGVLVGLALGVKIIYLLPYAFLLKLEQFRKPAWILGVLSSLGLVHLPFLFNPRSLYRSLVVANSENTMVLRKAGLTLATFLDRQFHWYPPESYFLYALVGLGTILWLILPKTRDVSRVLLMVSFVFILFLFVGPYAPANYYFSAGSFVLLGLSCAFSKETKT